MPASVGVLTNAQMDALGVRNIVDALRFVPDVSFDPTTNSIAIRGIGANAGAGTTGIYIDDVPIQMRALEFSSNDTLPAVFDLDRIEVLRGPQGTLYGAGSEGGAVRYITSQPDMTAMNGHARAEVSAGRNGSLSAEAGAAVGGPVGDGFAFRASAWFRRDGGTVDKFDYFSGATTRRNANAADTAVLHGALAWTADSRLTVTVSDYFQNRAKYDTDNYWVGASDPGRGVLRSGAPETLADRDHFNLVSLKAEVDFGGFELISNSSYFFRLEHVQYYSGSLYNLSYFQQLIADGTDPLGEACTGGACLDGLYPLVTADAYNLPGFGPYASPNTVTNRQKNFVQEIRLQSNDPEARLIWTAGLFLALDTQQSIDVVYDPQLADITRYLWGEDLMTAWGEDLLANGDEFINDTIAHDRQIAGYLNASFAVTDWLKLQGGLRLSRTHYDFRNYSDGPQNFGYDSGDGRNDETPVTAMAGITVNSSDQDMQYFSYSTGYRIGGANAPIPQASCQADLDALGLDHVPETYASDRVTSFEAGSKDRFLDGRLELEASLYHLTWSKIQQANYLTSCGFRYIANFGSAVSRGFDLEADWIATDRLEVHLSLGYMDAHYTTDSRSGTGPGAAIIARKNDALAGSPWSFAIDAQYNFLVAGRDAFVRLDDEFSSHNSRPTPLMDPATTQYDPGLKNDPATNLVSLRLGAVVGKATATLFVENLLDSQPQLNLDRMDRYTLLYEASTFRPRTVGLTLSYRY